MFLRESCPSWEDEKVAKVGKQATRTSPSIGFPARVCGLPEPEEIVLHAGRKRPPSQRAGGPLLLWCSQVENREEGKG